MPLDSRGPRAWLEAPVESGPRAGFGVYLHVPFCRHRCGYCDFAVSDRHGDWTDRYVAALREDLRRTIATGPTAVAPPSDHVVAGDWPAVTSIFVGGGTPTLLPAADLAAVLATLRDELTVAGDAEVSIEANPENLDPAYASALVDAGVTRLSIGAQSFTPSLLELLERGHGPETIEQAVRAARVAGIGQVSLDLMFGSPGETESHWRDSLQRAMALAPEHLSAYALTIHENTPFGVRAARGDLPRTDDDVQRAFFEVAGEVLGAGGYEHYEVSNFALGGGDNRSAHNSLYWRHGDYLGLGVGAHGHWSGRRQWSTRGIESYVTAVEQGRSPVAGSEILDDDERALERLLLGLRLKEGLHPNDVPPIEPLALEDAMDADLVTTGCGRLQATTNGWFVLDEAVRRLT